MEEVPLIQLGEAELERLVRGWRRGAGSWFQRRWEAYWKKRSVIRREDDVDEIKTIKISRRDTVYGINEDYDDFVDDNLERSSECEQQTASVVTERWWRWWWWRCRLLRRATAAVTDPKESWSSLAGLVQTTAEHVHVRTSQCLQQLTDVRVCSAFSSDVVLGFGPWSLVVLKDKTSVLGPVFGLKGVVLAKAYKFTVFTDTYMDLVIMLFCKLICTMNVYLLNTHYTTATFVCWNVLPCRI